MTYPKTLKSIRMLKISEILFFISELFTIITAVATGVAFVFSEQLGENTLSVIVLLIFGSALAAVCIKTAGHILNLVSARMASAEDENFKVAFYSIIITLLIVLVGMFFSFNKDVQSIADLLVTLTALLADVYLLEGIRSICKQLGHPEMDKCGGILYAVITTFFVLQTCFSVYILVLGGTMATIGAAALEVFDSILGIVQCILLFLYFRRTQKILENE